MKKLTAQGKKKALLNGAVMSWARGDTADGVAGKQNIIRLGLLDYYLFNPEEIGSAEWKSCKEQQNKDWADDAVPTVLPWNKRK